MDQSAELLNQLKDIELPARSGLPIAPAWFLLFGLIFLLIYLLHQQWRKYQHRKQTNWRPEARAALASIRTDIEKGNFAKILPETSQLARRIALAREPRVEVADLTGDAWLKKLDELADNQRFTTGVGRVLLSAPYKGEIIEDKTLLLDIVDAVECLVTIENRSHEATDRITNDRKANGFVKKLLNTLPSK